MCQMYYDKAVAFLNRRDQISLLFFSVHVKDPLDAHVKDAREMARAKSFDLV